MGQAASLRWSVENADKVEIDNGIGLVDLNGRRDLSPTVTTTYKLLASRSGVNTPAEFTITVITAPARAATSANTSSSEGHVTSEAVAAHLKDIHFAYGEDDVIQDDRALLASDAEALKEWLAADPNLSFLIEGHCDERGSAEYNTGLGDRRATFIKTSLVSLGVPEDKLNTVSYGKERPTCQDSTEQCHFRNRRAHFSLAQ